MTAHPTPADEVPLGNRLYAGLDNMISTQMTAYPDHWSDEDKRDVAIRHLGLGNSKMEVACG